MKHRPAVPAGGENFPLEILRCLSEWFSVLEDRGTVPGKWWIAGHLQAARQTYSEGTSLGAMVGTIAAFEDSLNGGCTVSIGPSHPYLHSFQHWNAF